ncbi:hypothetical protein AAAC51_21770 [Priestia megaterium]
MPKTGGRIVIGATKLQHDFTKTVSAQGIQFLLNKASALLPAIKEATFEKHGLVFVRKQMMAGLI